MQKRSLYYSKLSTYLSTAAMAALVLRTLLLTLHFISLPHAIDPHTGHFVHLHNHASEELHQYEPPTARSKPGIQANSHSCCDSCAHDCPYNHFLHQPSSQNLNLVDNIWILPPSAETSLPYGLSLFIRDDLHLLAPMNSPPV